jgi:hypothetical protein
MAQIIWAFDARFVILHPCDAHAGQTAVHCAENQPHGRPADRSTGGNRLNDRHDSLAWSGLGAVTGTRAALALAGVTPHARAWCHFLDRLLLWSGTLALAAAAVFFIACNWSDFGNMPRFALVAALVLVAVLGFGRLGADTATGKACLPAGASSCSNSRPSIHAR